MRSLPTPEAQAGQLETNWSDDTYRKMATTLVVYGKKGKIVADRQELRGHLRPRRRVRA
jgi:scyllo-inositol 2-dehydrogenase (NADP+)